MSIMFRSDISPCREPDGGASHLGVEPALDIMINFLMQSESRKGFSAIKANRGNLILDISEYFKGFGKVIIPVDNYLCSSFHKHYYIVLPLIAFESSGVVEDKKKDKGGEWAGGEFATPTSVSPSPSNYGHPHICGAASF